VYRFTGTHAAMYVHIYIYLHIHVYMYTYIHKGIHLSMDLYIHTYIWKCELILYLTYFTYNETSKMHLALSQAYALMWICIDVDAFVSEIYTTTKMSCVHLTWSNTNMYVYTNICLLIYITIKKKKTHLVFSNMWAYLYLHLYIKYISCIISHQANWF